MSGSSNKCDCEIFFVVSVFECLKCECKSVSNMFVYVCVCGRLKKPDILYSLVFVVILNGFSIATCNNIL